MRENCTSLLWKWHCRVTALRDIGACSETGATRPTKELKLTAEMPTIGRETFLPRLRRAFMLGAIGIVAVGLSFALFSWLNQRSVSLVMESQRTGRIAREARNLVLDRETGIRGYLLSGQRISLAPEFTARDPLSYKLDSLMLLTHEDVSQQDRARAVRNAVKRWERGWAMPVLAQNDATARLRASENPAGKELFDSIRSAFASFMVGEQRILSRRVEILDTLERFTFAAIITEILLLLGVLLWVSRRSFTQARQLMEQQEQLLVQSLDLQQQAAELAAAEAVVNSARSQQHEMQSLLDFVLNNSPVGVVLYDRDRRIVRVNAAVEAITGVPAVEHVGKTVDELLNDDIAETVDGAVGQVLATRQPVVNVPLTGASRNAPTTERHFLSSYFPVTLPGNREGAGSLVLETTQYRQLEEQLLQAQKMEAVGRLAGGVAHDFNNMLTAIMSYSELVLADMESGSPQNADMMEIVKAAEKATALTRQLLAFSRQQVLRPTRVDVNATVDGLRQMMKRTTANNIELTCRLAPDLWTVTADPAELERVIMNLVLNSRDAMSDGGKLIIETSNVNIDDEYASTHANATPGSYVLLAVTDTGTGMSREVRGKLFEPFFTTKEKGKGTGLGLSTVYGIVKLSGGFVWVYSEPDKGTTFRIYLPRSGDVRPRSTLMPPRNRKVGTETILLVEDDDEVRQVATRILRRSGYRVLEASNGADALRVCKSEPEPVDLIVTDIVMPEMGGSELAQRIRETRPDARILFTSGYTGDAVVRQRFLHEGEAFIEKPFTPASLTQKAREVLGSTGGPSAP